MSPARRARVGAFFDVDKTIISENSGTLYLRALYERGEIDGLTVLRNLALYLRYKLDLLDLERWVRGSVRDLAGRSERAMAREANRWFRQYVRPTIYPEAEQLTARHAEQGHVVALVSGATRFVLRPLARHLRVKHVMYTHLEVEQGRFTGRVLPPVCFGEGKIYWVRQLVEREGIDLARSYFYTDSITDLPLLELVGHPQAVNPDPLLYRQARRRCWPVRFFSAPRPAAPQRSGGSGS